MTLRVGLVGAAWGAFAHLPAWRSLDGVEVTAICTSSRETAEAAAERFDIAKPFWDAEEMCRDTDIDIVDLGTRPSVRLPMALAALRAGKHIYNGCPHAPDWVGAKAIDKAWDRGQSQCAVDAYSQYLPAHQTMKAMIDDGYLGSPLGGTCHFNLSLFNRPNRQFPYNWFADGKAGVSALRNNGGHLLYLLLHLFGPVEELIADEMLLLPEWEFAQEDRLAPENNDFANVILRFVNGAAVTLQASWSMPVHNGWMVDLFGTNGRIVSRSPTFPTALDCTIEAAKTGDNLTKVDLDFSQHPDISLGWEDNPAPSYPMALSMHALVAAINGSGNAAPGFATALEAERILEAARISNDARRWVKVSEIH